MSHVFSIKMTLRDLGRRTEIEVEVYEYRVMYIFLKLLKKDGFIFCQSMFVTKSM